MLERWSRPAAMLMASTAVAAGCGSSPPSATDRTSGPAISAVPGSSPPAALESVLRQSWEGYRSSLISGDGRVQDPKRGGATTSEGQSYALLRSVWMDDRHTFDAAWSWTRANLQVRGDRLFAYLWEPGGQRVSDSHSATDADTDIALALLLASRRWGDASYHDAAGTVIADIWNVDTVDAAGMRVVTAGDWASRQGDPGPVVNPSYFAPYAYLIFAAEDGRHPWMSLVDSSYALLDRCSSAELGGRPSAGLPPNWCAIRRGDGGISGFEQISGADDYGYDAFRVMWRVALDVQWNHEDRGRAYLERTAFLRDQWRQHGRLAAVYGHDGTVVSGDEDPTLYGGDLGNLLVTDAGAAQRVIDEKLLPAFSSTGPSPHFGDPSNYYEQNWVWFGIALSGAALDDFSGGG